MGLDMYLSGAVEAPADSAIAKVIEEHLTDEDREHVGDVEWSGDGSTYVGGWDFRPHPLYQPLCLELGYTPHEGSPHFSLFPRVVAGVQSGWLVEPTVYYWRKANAIHRWFVETCQEGIDECQKSPVHPEVLMDLLGKIEAVHEDPSRAPRLFPAGSGPFFGSTDYDEGFFQEIADDAVALKTQIALLMPRNPKFYYQASW